MTVKTEINRVGLLRGRSPVLRRLELDARSGNVSRMGQRNAADRMSKRDRGGISDDLRKNRSLLPKAYGGSEISDAQMVHRERGQELQLVQRFAAVFGDRETPVQGAARRLRTAACKYQRQPQCRLQVHFLESRTSGVVESGKCGLRPAMTFGQQGHCEENRYRGRGQRHAGRGIAVGTEAPFQGGANIAKTVKIGR